MPARQNLNLLPFTALFITLIENFPQIKEARTVSRSPKKMWQWCDKDGVYVDFSNETSEIIDEKHRKAECSFSLRVDGREYRFDLKRLVQFTEGGEGCSEAGERRLRQQSKELELPPTWCNQTEPIEIFPVQPDEADFDKAKNILFNSGPNATLNESAFQIHCVRRVQNLPAYERYALERKLLIQLRSAGACEPAPRAFSCGCAGAACMA